MFPHVANYPQSFTYFHHHMSYARPKYSFIGLAFLPRDHASPDIQVRFKLVHTIDRSSTIAQINIRYLRQHKLFSRSEMSSSNWPDVMTCQSFLIFSNILFFFGGFKWQLHVLNVESIVENESISCFRFIYLFTHNINVVFFVRVCGIHIYYCGTPAC